MKSVEEFAAQRREDMVEELKGISPSSVVGKTRAKKTELVEIYTKLREEHTDPAGEVSIGVDPGIGPDELAVVVASPRRSGKSMDVEKWAREAVKANQPKPEEEPELDASPQDIRAEAAMAQGSSVANTIAAAAQLKETAAAASKNGETAVERRNTDARRRVSKVPTEVLHRVSSWAHLNPNNRQSKRKKIAVGKKLERTLARYGVTLMEACANI